MITLLMFGLLGVDATHIGQVKVGTYHVTRDSKLPFKGGVKIDKAADESPLIAGDVITEIDGKKVLESKQFLDTKTSAKENKTYRLTVYRQDPDKKNKWVKRIVPVLLNNGKPDLLPEADPDPLPRRRRLILPDSNDPPEKLFLPNDCVHTPSGVLRLQIDSRIVYLPAIGDKTYYRFFSHSFKEYGSSEVQYDKGGFYKVKGEASEILLSSSDEKILTLEQSPKLGLAMKFLNAGDVSIDVKFDGDEFKQEIKVVRLPINFRESDNSVVKALGLPDEEKKHYTSWPDTKTFDNIIYSPSASDSIFAATHWRWNKYQNLTVGIVDSKVFGIGSNRERSEKEVLSEMRAWREIVPTKE